MCAEEGSTIFTGALLELFCDYLHKHVTYECSLSVQGILQVGPRRPILVQEAADPCHLQLPKACRHTVLACLKRVVSIADVKAQHWRGLQCL